MRRAVLAAVMIASNQVLVDRQTHSLWSQLLGGAITGRYRGTRLRARPVVEETWARWRADHPRTLVLSIRRDRFAARFTHPSMLVGAQGETPSNRPYLDHLAKVDRYHPQTVRGVRDSELVLAGVRLPRLPSIVSFWFAWRAAHPVGALYRDPKRPG